MFKYRKFDVLPKNIIGAKSREIALMELGFTELNAINWEESKLKGIEVRDFDKFFIEDIGGETFYLYKDKNNDVYMFVGMYVSEYVIHKLQMIKIDDEYADYIANRTRKQLLIDLKEEFLGKIVTLRDIEELQHTTNEYYHLDNEESCLMCGHTFLIDGMDVAFEWEFMSDIPDEEYRPFDYNDILDFKVKVEDIYIEF